MQRKNLFIDEDIWARLIKVAKEQGATISDLIRRGIILVLKELEK